MSFTAKLAQFLKDPVVDKIIGFVVILPSFYVLYFYWTQVQYGTFDWYHLAIAVDQVVVIVTTLTRRAAVRLSLNPFFWMVTLLRTYWAFVVLQYVYAYGAPSLAPLFVTNALLILSMIIIVYARLNLGRNIGFIPAKRQLVTAGLYNYVRHPIHTGELIFFVSYLLASYTPFNFFLISLGFVFIVAKTYVEEYFFKDDPEYIAYKKKVPYLWVPGVF